MNPTRWCVARSWRGVLCALWPLLAVLASGCSSTVQDLTERPPMPFLDGRSLDGALRLTWDSRLYPPPEGGSEPPDQPRQVLLYISEESATSGYRLLADRPGGIIDSLTIPNLANGKPYYFQATVFLRSVRPYFTSDPIVVVPGVDPQPLLSIDNGQSGPFRSAAAWSPDGAELLFVAQDGTRPQLRILNLATRAERTLPTVPSEYLSDPTWSPSGAQIAYTSTPSLTFGELDYRVWVTDTEGTASVSVSPGRVDFGSAWGSADSILIHLRGTHEPPNIAELYRVDPRTPNAVIRITSDQRMNKRFLSVRRSDNQILFTGRSGNAVGIYTVPVFGGAITPVITSRWWEDSAPSWSPDGHRIAFTSTRSGHPDIWILDLVTREYRQVTTGRPRSFSYRFASWSPDGTRLAIVEQGADGRWQIDVLEAP